jgi:hypothetical protein
MAEESAAAAEEMSAQSIALKEAVVNLQQLAGSAVARAPGGTLVSPTTAVAPKAKTQAPVARNGAAKLTPPGRGRGLQVAANGHSQDANRHDEFFKDS